MKPKRYWSLDDCPGFIGTKKEVQAALDPGETMSPVLVMPLDKNAVRLMDDRVWTIIHGFTDCGANRSSLLSHRILAALGIFQQPRPSRAKGKGSK